MHAVKTPHVDRRYSELSATARVVVHMVLLSYYLYLAGREELKRYRHARPFVALTTMDGLERTQGGRWDGAVFK